MKKLSSRRQLKYFLARLLEIEREEKWKCFSLRGKIPAPKKFISHQSPPERAYQTDLFGHSLHWIGIKRSYIDYLSISYVPFKNEIPRKVCRVQPQKGAPSHLKLLLRFLLHAIARIFSKMFIHVNFQQERGRNFRTSSFIIHIDEK